MNGTFTHVVAFNCHTTTGLLLLEAREALRGNGALLWLAGQTVGAALAPMTLAFEIDARFCECDGWLSGIGVRGCRERVSRGG